MDSRQIRAQWLAVAEHAATGAPSTEINTQAMGKYMIEMMDDHRSVAEWFHEIADLLDERIKKLSAQAKFTKQASKATVPLHEVREKVITEINDVREMIHSLPGWTGDETDTVKQNNAMREAIRKALAVHEDAGCSCDGCAALRRVL